MRRHRRQSEAAARNREHRKPGAGPDREALFCRALPPLACCLARRRLLPARSGAEAGSLPEEVVEKFSATLTEEVEYE